MGGSEHRGRRTEALRRARAPFVDLRLWREPASRFGGQAEGEAIRQAAERNLDRYRRGLLERLARLCRTSGAVLLSRDAPEGRVYDVFRILDGDRLEPHELNIFDAQLARDIAGDLDVGLEELALRGASARRLELEFDDGVTFWFGR
jgi:hypothetical protein